MSITMHHLGPKCLVRKSTRHRRWYFISWPTQETALPSQILSASAENVCHFTTILGTPEENVFCGYVHFREPYSPEELHSMSGYIFQWIPAFLAHTHPNLPVDYLKWREDDFDFDLFLQTIYPWAEMSDIIYHYHLDLIATNTSCIHKDSLIIVL